MVAMVAAAIAAIGGVGDRVAHGGPIVAVWWYRSDFMVLYCCDGWKSCHDEFGAVFEKNTSISY